MVVVVAQCHRGGDGGGVGVHVRPTHKLGPTSGGATQLAADEVASQFHACLFKRGLCTLATNSLPPRTHFLQHT